MKYSLEQFIEISELDSAEASALKTLLADKETVKLAESIAEQTFINGHFENIPYFPEGAYLSQAWFVAAFLSFDNSYERYQKLNFPEAVWLDSMTDLKIWLRNELHNRNVIGLGKLARPWEVAMYQGVVSRHGRLECNTSCNYKRSNLTDRSGKTILKTGDQVINLHIPEAGAMDMDACGRSLQKMAEFFAKYRSDYQWKGFLCESWLLDRQLEALLPETSNILKFQKLGIKYTLDCPSDAIVRIFGVDDWQSVPVKTSLQRNAAEFLKNGGAFLEEGIFIPRESVEAVNFDLNKLLENNQRSLSSMS